MALLLGHINCLWIYFHHARENIYSYVPIYIYIFSPRDSAQGTSLNDRILYSLFTYCDCSLCGYLFWAILKILLVLVIFDQ